MNPTPPIDMECLHKHHMAKLADARRKLEVAQNEVEKWEILEAASSKLAIVAMHHRWAKDLNTPNDKLSDGSGCALPQ